MRWSGVSQRLSRFRWSAWRIAAGIGLVAAFWTISLTWAQSGLPGMKRLAIPLFAVLFVFFILNDVFERHRDPKFLVVQVPLLLGPSFSLLCGDRVERTALFNVLSVTAGILVFYVVAWLLMAAVQRKSPDKLYPGALTHWSLFAGCLLAGWISLSIAWAHRDSALPIDAQRFEKPIPTTLPASRLPDLRVGLALSGGGYRAATFHAGTVHALENLGVRPAIVSSVSGGSIFAAYYANGGDPEAFAGAVSEGRFSLRRKLLLVQNASRLGFPFTIPYVNTELFPWYRFNRRDAQAELIQSALLDNVDVHRTATPHQPILAIATTDLVRGGVVGRVPNGYVEVDTTGRQRFFHHALLTFDPSPTLSDWVAISGAFPVAIPPAKLKARLTGWPLKGQAATVNDFEVVLVDGGVIDNRGELLLSAANEDACVIRSDQALPCIQELAEVDFMLTSDAGAVFDEAHELGGLRALDRAFDVGTIRGRKKSTISPVSFSVQQFVSDKSFLTGKAVLEKSLPGYDQDWARNLDLYPDEVLQAMIELRPGRDAEFRSRRARCVFFENLRADKRVCSFTAEERTEAIPLILGGVAADIHAFRELSTLNDQPSPADVESMFRLGQMLVYLKWPELKRQMDSVRTQKQFLRPPPHGAQDMSIKPYESPAPQPGQSTGTNANITR